MTKPTDDVAALQRAGARVAARAEIRDVRFLSSDFAISEPPAVGSILQVGVVMNPTVEYSEDDAAILVTSSYEITIQTASDQASPEPIEPAGVAKISFRIALMATLEHRETETPLTTEEVEAYAATTGNFAIYPYAREYVQSVTTRMGLPPLTLNVLRLPAAGPKEKAARPQVKRAKKPSAEIKS